MVIKKPVLRPYTSEIQRAFNVQAIYHQKLLNPCLRNPFLVVDIFCNLYGGGLRFTIIFVYCSVIGRCVEHKTQWCYNLVGCYPLSEVNHRNLLWSQLSQAHTHILARPEVIKIIHFGPVIGQLF